MILPDDDVFACLKDNAVLAHFILATLDNEIAGAEKIHDGRLVPPVKFGDYKLEISANRFLAFRSGNLEADQRGCLRETATFVLSWCCAAAGAID